MAAPLGPPHGPPTGRSIQASTEAKSTGSPGAALTPPRRVAWIDHLKAFGMFLVVYGHSELHQPVLVRWIYAFHIPLFFLVSGYLIKESHLAETFGAFLRRGARSLLVPYLVFAAIGYLFWLLIERKFGQSLHAATPLLSPIWAALYGTAKPEHFHVEPIVLWFLPCLFMAQALFYLAQQAGAAAYFISAALVAIGLLLPPSLALPFQFETALVAQGYLLLGFEAGKRKWLALFAGHPLVWSMGFLVVGTVLALGNSRVDMRGSEYGNILVFPLASIGLSVAFALMFMTAPRLSLSEIISKNTLFIFSFHPMVFSLFSALYVFVLRQPLSFRQEPVVSLVASVINCLVLACGAEAVSRAMRPSAGVKK